MTDAFRADIEATTPIRTGYLRVLDTPPPSYTISFPRLKELLEVSREVVKSLRTDNPDTGLLAAALERASEGVLEVQHGDEAEGRHPR